jgi:tyrosinase
MDAILRMTGGDGDPTSFTNCRVRESSSSGCNCTVTRGPWAGVSVLGEWGIDLGWTLQRSFGCMESSLPTSDVVDHIANLTYYNSTVYESFRPMVGGLTERPRWPFSWPPSIDGIDMHARVHKWLGGTMMGNYAPNDPIFFLVILVTQCIFLSDHFANQGVCVVC